MYSDEWVVHQIKLSDATPPPFCSHNMLPNNCFVYSYDSYPFCHPIRNMTQLEHPLIRCSFLFVLRTLLWWTLKLINVVCFSYQTFRGACSSLSFVYLIDHCIFIVRTNSWTTPKEIVMHNKLSCLLLFAFFIILFLSHFFLHFFTINDEFSIPYSLDALSIIQITDNIHHEIETSMGWAKRTFFNKIDNNLLILYEWTYCYQISKVVGWETCDHVIGW